MLSNTAWHSCRLVPAELWLRPDADDKKASGHAQLVRQVYLVRLHWCARRSFPTPVSIPGTCTNSKEVCVLHFLFGPRTMKQLDGSLRALEIRLEAEQMQTLDRIFPGPGGEAPEAYAW